MYAHEAKKAVTILKPKVAIPILEHNFSGSLVWFILETTTTRQDFNDMILREGIETKVMLLAPGESWFLDKL